MRISVDLHNLFDNNPQAERFEQLLRTLDELEGQLTQLIPDPSEDMEKLNPAIEWETRGLLQAIGDTREKLALAIVYAGNQERHDLASSLVAYLSIQRHNARLREAMGNTTQPASA